MKPNFISFSLLAISFIISGCSSLCDDTIEQRIDYVMVCNDKSNLIQTVFQTFQGDSVLVYKNDVGDDTVKWNVAIDKPGTTLLIKRANNINFIQYTLHVTKEFDPRSPCADNSIVYKTDPIKIDSTNCSNMEVNYVERNSQFNFSTNFKGWVVQFN